MLTERQLTLIDLLEHQALSLGELARKTGVSGRTVLRDLDYLNFTFSGKAHIHPGGNAGYQLEIVDKRGFFQLLQRHDNDDRLLALLLLNPFTPRIQLASALNLPEAWVAEKLPRLKQRYERAFCLASRPGLGHFIDEPEEKRIILLANLLRKDPLLIPLPGLTAENITQLYTHCEKQCLFPLMPGNYLASLVLAIYALRNQLKTDWPACAPKTLTTFVDQAGIYLGDNACRALFGLLETQRQQAEKISCDTVISLLQCVPGIVSLHIIDEQLIENITGHLLRCVSAPVWIAEYRPSSMNNLKAAWPSAFDMSLHFIALLREKLNILLFDSDLIGLYFACALERHQNERHPVILLSDQNAIATINQQAIERDVLNCRVVIARKPEDVNALLQEIEPLLIINNSHHLLDERSKNVLVIKNIITAAGTEQIRNFLATAFIRQQPERFFLKNGSFHLSNPPHSRWHHVISDICGQLVARQAITKDEAQRICARESEGENLVVNHLAIPHCWSEQADHFRGFFITLEHSVHVCGEPVNHVLVTCAAADARDELKIFSYLSGTLMRYPWETIKNLSGYESFITLLQQP